MFRPPTVRHPGLLLAFVAGLVLSACQVDVAVDVVVDDDGSGSVTVTADLDAEIVDEIPELTDDLAFDDLESKGWTVELPDSGGPDGGIRVVLQRDFADLDELNTALDQLGGPFQGMNLTRADEFARSTWTLAGNLRLDDGLAGFADAELIEAVRAVPYQDDLDARGLSVDDAVTVTFSIQVPGQVLETTGIESRDGSVTVITWSPPLDGSSMSVATVTERRDRGAELADTVSAVAQFVLVTWVVVSVTFIAWVIFARQRKRRRQRLRGTPPA